MANKKKPEGSGRKKGQSSNNMTEAEYYKWANIVIELMITKGLSKWTVIKQLNEQGLSTYQTKEVMKIAGEHIKKVYSGRVETSLEFALSQLYDLYEASVKEGDKITALNIRKEINKLSGLHKEKLEIEGSLTIPQVIKIVEVKKED